MVRSLFHLAFNVTDLDATRRFYGDVLGCVEGRSTDTWVDFDFFGHQISMHLGEPFKTENTGRVGGHLVPMPHPSGNPIEAKGFVDFDGVFET